jgi:cytidyltransferase-like protein
MKDNIVIVTGGFDPIHSGHIDYINSAKEYGRVVIGLNSDDWLKRKKGISFMSYDERYAITSNLKGVLCVIDFDDSDNSACDAIQKVKNIFPNTNIIFANGGDRTEQNIPEMDRYKDDPFVSFEFGVGGENKKNSSSWILQEWKAPKTERPWGYYRVLHEVPGMKVKELTINPKCELSMQKHDHRAEYWIVSEGRAQVSSMLKSGYNIPTVNLEKHDTQDIIKNSWHKLLNPYDEPCRIVEIQYGEMCVEEDIERKE